MDKQNGGTVLGKYIDESRIVVSGIDRVIVINNYSLYGLINRLRKTPDDRPLIMVAASMRGKRERISPLNLRQADWYRDTHNG